MTITPKAPDARDLQWAGASKRLDPDAGMGFVTGLKLGVSGPPAEAAKPVNSPLPATSDGKPDRMRIDVAQMTRPGDDGVVQPNGRMRLA